MKLSEQIGLLIREVEKARYPEDNDAYKLICGHISELKRQSTALYDLMEILKQIDNIQYMMHSYLPRPNYDTYGSNSRMDPERNYQSLSKEKKRLLTTLHKLKSLVEALGDDTSC